MMKLPLLIITTAVTLVACGVNEPQNTTKNTDADKTQQFPPQEVLIEPEFTQDRAVASAPMMKVQQLNMNNSLHEDFILIESEAAILEPNHENYAAQDISPIKIVSQTPVSTFSTDVDTASYTNARRYMLQGQQPPANAIRVEEFINYFDYQLKSPKSIDHPIAIDTELMATPWNKNTQLMRVSLQAYTSTIQDLPPLNLVFLLDVSGSMNSPDKLQLMQKSFNLLVNKLRPEDHVAIVVYAGDSGVALEPTSGSNKAEIMQAINNLRAGGGTHGSAGIHLAYELAEQHFDNDGINRIFLGTDGDFNVGTTDIEALKQLVEKKRDSGVFLSVLGFGTGNYNDYLMEEISNNGNGTAYYIDSFQEARKIFSEHLISTLQVIAKDVKIQVEFNPEQVAEYRLIGYDNRRLNREDFTNDAVDAGEMGSGHSVTALYEIVPVQSEFRFNQPLRYQAAETVNISDTQEIAFVKVRYKKPNESTSAPMDIPVTWHTLATPSDSMALSANVAWFAEILRDSKYVQSKEIAQLINPISENVKYDRWGYRQELLQLVKNMAEIQVSE